jgi:hypothetical protein
MAVNCVLHRQKRNRKYNSKTPAGIMSCWKPKVDLRIILKTCKGFAEKMIIGLLFLKISDNHYIRDDVFDHFVA